MKQNRTERSKMKQNKTQRDAKEVEQMYQSLTKRNSPLTKGREMKQNTFPKKTTQNKTKINEMKQKTKTHQRGRGPCPP